MSPRGHFLCRQLKVGKRLIHGGTVRVFTHTTERPVEQKVSLQQETARVERHPVNRPLTSADQDAFRERSVEVSESREEPVVAKEARVVEEVVVNKDVRQDTRTVRDKVRKTDVEVQRGEARPGQTVAFVPDSYAGELARDQRFHGRDWAEIERDARLDYERRYPNRRWEEDRDAIHSGYTRASTRP